MNENLFWEILPSFTKTSNPVAAQQWELFKKQKEKILAFPPTYKLRELSSLLERSLSQSKSSREPSFEKKAQIFIINGVFYPQMSTPPQEIEVLSFSEARKPFEAFFSQYFSKLSQENDFFSLLNSAFFEEGLFIYIPPNKKIDSPLVVTHVLTGDQPAFPRVIVYVGKNSSAQIFFSQEVRRACFNNEHIDCFLDENASLDLCAVDEGCRENWQFRSVNAQLKKASRFFGISYGAKTKVLRNSFKAFLKGEDCDASFFSGWTLFERETAHAEGCIEHLKPHCHSMQSFKGILNGQSRSSIEGRIYVDPIAQKTEAYQKIAHLLLDEKAIAINKPSLEILADDVKASHGATVGQLNPEELFYLQSRGLNIQEAKQLLVMAFCNDFISKFPIEKARLLAQGLACLTSL